jgi:hypothetical protein
MVRAVLRTMMPVGVFRRGKTESKGMGVVRLRGRSWWQ